MIMHVAYSFSDRIFKPIQRMQAEEEVYFSWQNSENNDRKCKLETVKKKSGLDTMQVLEKYAKVILTQPHSLEWQKY